MIQPAIRNLTIVQGITYDDAFIRRTGGTSGPVVNLTGYRVSMEVWSEAGVKLLDFDSNTTGPIGEMVYIGDALGTVLFYADTQNVPTGYHKYNYFETAPGGKKRCLFKGFFLVQPKQVN